MQTQVSFNTSKTYVNTEMRFVNSRDNKLFIEKQTRLKIDFKRLKKHI